MKKTTETAPDGETQPTNWMPDVIFDDPSDEGSIEPALTPKEYAVLHTPASTEYDLPEPGDLPAPYVQDAPKTVDVVNLTGNDLIEALYDAGYIYLREGVLVVNIFHEKAEQYVAVDCSNLVGVQLRRLKKFQAAAGPDKELKAELGKALKRSKGKTEAELWAIFKEQLALMSSDTGDN